MGIEWVKLASTFRLRHPKMYQTNNKIVSIFHPWHKWYDWPPFQCHIILIMHWHLQNKYKPYFTHVHVKYKKIETSCPAIRRSGERESVAALESASERKKNAWPQARSFLYLFSFSFLLFVVYFLRQFLCIRIAISCIFFGVKNKIKMLALINTEIWYIIQGQRKVSVNSFVNQ